MVKEEKVDDLVINLKLEVGEIEDSRYVDIELSYYCEDQAEIDKILVAINNFVNANKKGLQKQSVNILGYSMY